MPAASATAAGRRVGLGLPTSGPARPRALLRTLRLVALGVAALPALSAAARHVDRSSELASGSLVERIALKQGLPAARGPRKHSKSAKRLAHADQKGHRRNSSSTFKGQEAVDLVDFTPPHLVGAAKLRCRDEGVSVVFSDPSREVIFGGEAMTRASDFLCKTVPNGPASDVMSTTKLFMREMLRLTNGAATIAALAAPREGGCETSSKIHGASVPILCTRRGESLHVRIGGASMGNGKRADRQARPGLEVSYRFGDSELPPEPCSCQQARTVLAEASGAVVLSSDTLWNASSLRFSSELFLMEGLAGALPLEDGQDGTAVFALKHVGTCFREALERGSEVAALSMAAEEFRARLRSAKLMVSWDTDGPGMVAAGALRETYTFLMSLGQYAMRTAALDLSAPDRRLCTPSEPEPERHLPESERLISIVKSTIPTASASSTSSGPAGEGAAPAQARHAPSP